MKLAVPALVLMLASAGAALSPPSRLPLCRPSTDNFRASAPASLELRGGMMGSNESNMVADASPPSLVRRMTLVAGYAGLVAVNLLSGMGKLPLISGDLGPSNAVVSGRWPTLVTPAGYAFAIWGPIFLIQGASVIWSLLPAEQGSAKAKAINAVAPAWLSMWTFEILWQFVFVNAPMAPGAGMREQLQCFVPASALLCAAYASSLAACRRLKAVQDTAETESRGAVGPLLELSAALNAGWLSAASCIDAALVVESMAGGVAKASHAPAMVLAASAGLGGLLSLRAWGAGWLGMGYAGAVMWALQAVRYGPAAPADVKALAYGGVGVLGVAAGVALARAGASKGKED